MVTILVELAGILSWSRVYTGAYNQELEISMADKWGYIDRQGNWVIMPRFDDALGFMNGMAAAQTDGLYGYIGRSGEYLIKPRFTHAGADRAGYLKVTKSEADKVTLTNLDLQPISHQHFDSIGNFCCGLALVQLNKRYGYIDHGGSVTIELKYESASVFSEGLARINHLKDNFFIDQNGEVVLRCEHRVTSAFREGYATISLDTWHEGKIDRSGRIAIGLEFENIGNFSEGVCHASRDGRAFYMNHKGEKVFSQTFDRAGEFSGSRAVVREAEELYGVIDRQGRFIVKPRHKFIMNYVNGIAIIHLGELHGAIDRDGKVIINPKFKGIRNFNDEWAAACIEV